MKDLYWEKKEGNMRRSIYAFPVGMEFANKEHTKFKPSKKWSIIVENPSKKSKSNLKGLSQFYVKSSKEAKKEFNRLRKVI
jgi:hypothetical protein